MSHDTLTNEQWRDDRIAEVEADRDEWKARCLAAEATVKHHEHYVKTSVSIVADCEGELSKLRVAARQLVAALPKCMWIPDEDKEPELPDPCGAFATHQER